VNESRRLPAAVFAVAALMALLHLAPTWMAASEAASSDLAFTGNLRGSPDFMQYFAWSRRTEHTGPFVDNTFTPEPNSPHLLVLPYYAVGTVSRALGISPELTHVYLGAVYAFALVVLLFVVARTFLGSRTRTWWVLAALLWGGGLSGYLKFLPRFEFAYTKIMQRTLTYGERVSDLFEDFRGFYIFKTFFDSHFLLIWLVMTTAVLSLYIALQRFSWPRVALVSGLFAAATLIHVYEAVTLAAIGAGVLFIFWLKGLLEPKMLITVGAASVSAAICVVWQVAMFQSGGLDLPDWHEVNVLVSAVVLAFPLAWGLIAWGFGDYWSKAGFKECFVIGWLVACLAILFSGPFYPYPTRGAQTLQIPVTIMAGAIYFNLWNRVTLRAALIALVLLSGSSIWELSGEWARPRLTVDRPYAFLDPDRQEIIGRLEQAATAQDLLMARSGDLLWLAPRYPGRHYCGHFFLTVDYAEKCAALAEFYERPEDNLDFVRRARPRFLYVDRSEDPNRFADLPGFSLWADAPVGSVFEYTPR
jgi:hypothetical protein